MPGAKDHSIHVQIYMLTQMLFWFFVISGGTGHQLTVQYSGLITQPIEPTLDFQRYSKYPRIGSNIFCYHFPSKTFRTILAK